VGAVIQVPAQADGPTPVVPAMAEGVPPPKRGRLVVPEADGMAALMAESSSSSEEDQVVVEEGGSSEEEDLFDVA
jgi:hypothetical protein